MGDIVVTPDSHKISSSIKMGSYYHGPTSGSANVKGSYVTLITSLPHECSRLDIYVGWPTAGTYLIDIAVGAVGSEVIILPNLHFGCGYTSYGPPFIGRLEIPIRLPKGTRISARCQGSTGSSTIRVGILPHGYGALGQALNGKITAYGVTLASSRGASVDPGTATNEKNPTYKELTPSCSKMNGFFLAFSGQNNTSRTQGSWMVDVAVGAVGSELVIVKDFPLACSASYPAEMFPRFSPFFWIPIPAGTRISVTAASDITDASDRLFDTILYGMS